jgi:hypothetical protein
MKLVVLFANNMFFNDTIHFSKLMSFHFLNNVIAHIFLHAIISRVRVIIAFFIRLKACYSMPTYCT